MGYNTIRHDAIYGATISAGAPYDTETKAHIEKESKTETKPERLPSCRRGVSTLWSRAPKTSVGF